MIHNLKFKFKTTEKLCLYSTHFCRLLHPQKVTIFTAWAAHLSTSRSPGWHPGVGVRLAEKSCTTHFFLPPRNAGMTHVACPQIHSGASFAGEDVPWAPLGADSPVTGMFLWRTLMLMIATLWFVRVNGETALVLDASLGHPLHLPQCSMRKSLGNKVSPSSFGGTRVGLSLERLVSHRPNNRERSRTQTPIWKLFPYVRPHLWGRSNTQTWGRLSGMHTISSCDTSNCVWATHEQPLCSQPGAAESVQINTVAVPPNNK